MEQKTMLIVDDKEVNRSALAACFDDDFAILQAAGGQEAIQKMQQYAGQISVVLLDIVMPGTDGIAVLQWMRGVGCGIPVVAVTAEKGYQLQALENGAWDFIEKPAENAIIRTRVQNVLDHQDLAQTRLYQNVMKDSPIAIYVTNTQNRELLYMNSTARALSGLGQKPLAGQHCYQAMLHCDAPCADCPLNGPAEKDFSLHSGVQKDTGRAFTMKTRRIDWNGLDAQITYMVEETERMRAHAALEQKLAEQECLAACNRHLSENENFTQSIDKILAEMGRFYGADRCALIEVDRRADVARQLSRWSAGAAAPFPQAQRFSLEGCGMNSARLLETKYRWLPDVAAIQESDPRLYTFMATMNIRNLRSVCCSMNDTHLAFLAVCNADPARPESDLLSQVSFYVQHAMNRYYTNREMEENFTLAAAQSGLVVWRYDIAARTILSGPNSKEVYGYTDCLTEVPERLIAAGAVHPDDIALVREMYASLNAGAKTAGCTARWRRPATGEWWWAKTNYTTIFDADGNPLRAIGSSVDVTAERAAQQRYQDEVNYCRSLGGNALIASHRLNLTRCVVEESRSAIHRKPLCPNQKLTDALFRTLCAECIPDEAERRNYYDTFNPQALLRAFQAGTTELSVVYRAGLPDGTQRWVDARVKLMTKPDTQDLMAFLNTWDINERKTAQAMIDTVVNMDYDYLALIETKTGGYTLYSQKEDSNLLPPVYSGNYEKEVSAYAHAHLVEEDIERNIREMSLQNLEEQLEKQKIYTTFCAIREKDGGITHKRLQFSYLSRAEGLVILTRADITDIYENEQQKNAALTAALTAAEQANAAKTDFLSRMSHEIRTPMNAIIGMTAIAAQAIGDDEQISDCLSKIGISSRFLLSLINDILDMSRIESGKILLKKDRIPFEEFVNGINTICYGQAQGKDVDYECVVENGTEDCYMGDAMKLQQILLNILANAIKFTPQGGKVSLHVRQVRHTKTNALLRFVVNDTGCGISDEFLPHLFEPFAQEHSGTTSMYGGTGLGLAICKNLVELMDGHIRVRSIVGIGSEFTVDLKLGITEETRHHAVKTTVDFARLKALVVDDDVCVCEHTQIVLSDMGVHSEWVDSGRKAIDRVQAKWNEQNNYDLILIDWKMPEMDGIETARRIRRIVGPDVTIIIMTAYDWASIEGEAKRAGVNMLMGKPMFKSSLISAFEKAFGEKQEEKIAEKPLDYNFTGRRVLLAEDHPLNVEVARRLLESKGFAVEVAENGVRAVEMFTVTPVGYYDAILMDIRMPVMDGLQATRSIRHLSKADAARVPILAMTANAFDDDIDKSKLAGMNAHLAKPIEPEQLFRTLYEFMPAGQ